MKLFAYHTDDGVPMNETALCEQHARGEALGHATSMLSSADDAPVSAVFREVENPENNGTECFVCCLWEHLADQNHLT